MLTIQTILIGPPVRTDLGQSVYLLGSDKSHRNFLIFVIRIASNSDCKLLVI
jgi:hypothetical protein